MFKKKICKECRREFRPKCGTQVYCTRPHTSICVICNKEFEYTCSPNAKPKTCSIECQSELTKLTVKKKYGVDNALKLQDIKDKISEVNISDRVRTKRENRCKRICKECGKEFTCTGTQAYCDSLHYRKCEVCGKEFEWNHKNPKRCCSRTCSAILRKNTIKPHVKRCELCGKEFTSIWLKQKYCDDKHYRPCPICGKDVEIDMANVNTVSCCSIECSNKLREKTCLDKYGVPIASQDENVKKKLSIASIRSKSQSEKTCLEKYGVKHFAQLPETRQKLSNIIKSEQNQAKMKATMRERYGVDYIMQNKEFAKKVSNTILEKYDVPYYCLTKDCIDKNKKSISKINKEIGQRLTDNKHNIEYEYNIEDKLYDIAIHEMKTLIEINPTYTHNVIHNHYGRVVDKKYHIDKTKLAERYGYRCIHIFDWDNVDKILLLLKPKKIIYARKCIIRGIDVNTTNIFENLYHLQGKCNGQKVCLGLYYKGELIEIMTFGKPRYNKKYEWELLRLCTNSSFKVVGGASKLFKHFIKEYDPKSMISYCDLSKFNGSVYEKIGMKLDDTTEPNKIWSKEDKKITNNLLLSRGYDQLFNASFGKGTSNEELMLKDGWLPVYDCGQARYTWIADSSK